jgi:hypothetical protein
MKQPCIVFNIQYTFTYVCVAEEMNMVGPVGEAEEQQQYPWSPGELKYYGRAELKTSDHR